MKSCGILGKLRGKNGRIKMFDLLFYKGKRVFVTGHTGFKGSWLCKMLVNIGADVTGYSLNPSTNPSLFELRESRMISIL